MSKLAPYNPEAIALIAQSGLNVAELENPAQALLSAGVEKLALTRGTVAFLERSALKRDLDAMRARGEPEECIKKISEEIEAENNAPTWQRISGLFPKAAACMNPAERRKALARLHHAAKKLIRFELNKATLSKSGLESPATYGARASRARHSGDGVQIAKENSEFSSEQFQETSHTSPSSHKSHEESTSSAKATLENSEVPSEEAPPEKTFLWDPLPEVCHFLQISKAALTRFLRECTGVSANELVDMIRAEKLKEKLRMVLFPAIKELLVQIKKERRADRWFGKFGAMTIWKRLKDSRRHPKFHRAVLAIELGFPSHQRMYRACLLAYGKTPSQIEWELVEEAERNLDCTVTKAPEEIARNKRAALAEAEAEAKIQARIKEHEQAEARARNESAGTAPE